MGLNREGRVAECRVLGGMLQRGGWKEEAGKKSLLAAGLGEEQRELGRQRQDSHLDRLLTDMHLSNMRTSETPLAKTVVTLVLALSSSVLTRQTYVHSLNCRPDLTLFRRFLQDDPTPWRPNLTAKATLRRR